MVAGFHPALFAFSFFLRSIMSRSSCFFASTHFFSDAPSRLSFNRTRLRRDDMLARVLVVLISSSSSSSLGRAT